MSSSASTNSPSGNLEIPLNTPAVSTISGTDQPQQMAISVQSQTDGHVTSAKIPAHQRPTLPPIMSIDEFHRGLSQPPALTASYPSPPHNMHPASNMPYGALSQPHDRHGRDEAFHPARSPHENPHTVWSPHAQINPTDPQGVPSKRSYGTMLQWPERNTRPNSYTSWCSTHPEAESQLNRSLHSSIPPSSRSSFSDPLNPSRTHSLAASNLTDYSSASYQRSNTHRCILHIRQQPRAARAGPDGKDRRAIDPPPVLQLLLTDFDIESDEDMAELRSSYFVVHCRLVSAQSPKKDMSTLSSTNDDGSTEVQRLLLGTSVASPFFCTDDPDIDTMPTHPRSKANSTSDPAPPSPTSRFIMPRSSKSSSKMSKEYTNASGSLPGTFFIFADLSIRRAGEYRLEFCLMKVEPSTMVAGSKLPILYSVTSQVFKVVNAKDFDQVQPSTDLVKGLLDRGAGFPLKLKKGTREGGRRRNATDSEGGGGSIGGAEDEEDEDENENDNDNEHDDDDDI